MGLFDDKGKKKAVGGLSLLGNFKGTAASSSGSAWKPMWDARGPGFDFRLAKEETANIIFLTDVTVWNTCSLYTSWNKKGGYPNSDLVRSPMYSDDGEQIMDSCYISDVTCIDPRPVGFAVVLDLRPAEYGGKKYKYQVKRMLIKSWDALQALGNVSRASGKRLQYAKVEVGRSEGKTSPASGTSFFSDSYVTEKELDQEAPDWRDLLAKIDINAGYIRPNKETAKALLQVHTKLVDMHDLEDRDYNHRAWENFDSLDVTVNEPAEDAFAGMPDLDESDDETSEAAAAEETDTEVASAEFNTDDLDEALKDVLG